MYWCRMMLLDIVSIAGILELDCVSFVGAAGSAVHGQAVDPPPWLVLDELVVKLLPGSSLVFQPHCTYSLAFYSFVHGTADGQLSSDWSIDAAVLINTPTHTPLLSHYCNFYYFFYY